MDELRRKVQDAKTRLFDNHSGREYYKPRAVLVSYGEITEEVSSIAKCAALIGQKLDVFVPPQLISFCCQHNVQLNGILEGWSFQYATEPEPPAPVKTLFRGER